MNKLKLIILLFLSAIVFNGCSKKEDNTQKGSETVIPVEVSVVKESNIQRVIELVGTLAAWKEANLGANTTGRIEKIFVEEGSLVRAGDLLFQMDDTQLAQAKIQYEIARDDFNRLKPLYEQGSVSRQQYDKIKAAFETSEYSYNLILANTQFKAPFSGTVTAKKMNDGEIFMLAPGGSSAPSIVTLMQLNPLKLKVSISEIYFKNIKSGQKANIEADAFPGSVYEGTVSKINPTINPATRTFDVEIKLNNNETKIRPGMYVKAKLFIGGQTVISIPRSAALRQPGSNSYFGFVIEKDIAKRVSLQIGEEFDDLVEIRSGLKVGDLIVTTGQTMLKDGSRVKITSNVE